MRRKLRFWGAGVLFALAVTAFFSGPAFSRGGNDFHFAILGDRTGSAMPQIYGRVWREVAMLSPDFAINIGDTIQGGDDTRAETEWQELRAILRRYASFPFYFTPGNHDIWSDKSRELFERETGRRSFYSFNVQDAHFTVLDNSRTLDLDEEQLKFLEKDLRRNRHRRPKFIFFHKPYWVVFLKAGSGEFPLHRLARQYGVDQIISGHGHQFMRMERDGIGYVALGSSGAHFRRDLTPDQGFEQGAFYHFAWVRVKGTKVQVTIKEIGGPAGQGRMFRAEDWDADGPKFDTADPALKDEPET
ncbi:MAG TPA: metallophosphoesterase [Bryobacteraceae bacterium]|nr:metallophosphoesterase [Bryobacteraceae bacterium]